MDSETPRARLKRTRRRREAQTFSNRPPSTWPPCGQGQDLADFINSASDPVAIKQEFIGPNYDNMDLDGSMDVEITGVFSGNRSVDYENEEEEDETLLDEQGEYADHVVSCEEGEEESEEDDAEEVSGAGGDGVTTETAGTAGIEGVAVAADSSGTGGAGQEGGGGEAEPAPPQDAYEGEETARVNVEGEGEGEEDDNQELETEDIDLSDPNLKPDHRFFVVRAMLEGSMEPRSLNRRLKKPDPDPGFLVEGDERWYRNANISCTKKKLNTSASFNPRGGCHTCISGEHDAWIGAQGQPIVIVAADQHFPPNLPADREGECIRILRVENGNLAEIARELTLAAPADGMVRGSLVLLGAPAQLAVVSVEFSWQ
jgi:hypothetical protein